MVLSLGYGEIAKAITGSDRLADGLAQYCNDLSARFQQNLYAVEGGMSSALNSADYYVNSKIKQLKAHESNSRDLSAKSNILLETAKRVDADVEQMIQANQTDFFQRNPELKPSDWALKMAAVWGDIKNIPLLGWFAQAWENTASAFVVLAHEIRHWYKCEGGKELIASIISVALVVVAIVILVCAIFFTGGAILAVIAGVAGIISATIGLGDAVTNMCTSFEAYSEARAGNPAMAKIYSGQDKMSDVLRETNFHDKEKNRASFALATGIEVTDSVCSIITIAYGGYKSIQNLKDFNVSKMIKSMLQPREGGKFIKGESSLLNGAKLMIKNINLKDMLLGDLNVKNLSRLSTLKKVDKFKTIGDFAKAVKGVFDGFDKINAGKQTIGEFALNRVIIGLDKSMLQTQVLKTSTENGIKIRKYEDTNFTKLVKCIKLIPNDSGLGRFIMDKIDNKSLTNIFDMKKGIIQQGIKIKEAFGY